MTPTFGATSRKNLEGVHPDLVKVHNAVLPIFDHSVTDGARTVVEQEKNVARGVSKTMDSKHLKQPDGYAHATDAMPYPPPNWRLIDKSIEAVRAIDPTMAVFRFYHFQGVMKGVAAQMGVQLRQGVDWDMDTDVSDHRFIDLPHNELVPSHP